MGKTCCPRRRFSSILSRCRRWPLSRRTLLIASLCVVYLFFALAGFSQQRRHARGPDTVDRGLPLSVELRTGARLAAPTRSNVVYITLRSKRLKPANIRGTIRPKVRRKARRTKSTSSALTQDDAPPASWADTGDISFKSLNIKSESHADPSGRSIRMYSQRAPPWLSPEDVGTMRFLAEAKVWRITEASRGAAPTLLIFEGDSKRPGGEQQQRGGERGLCGGPCALIRKPVDSTEVFAFHLDRVLGLNRTLPAVSRTFSFLHDGRPCPVVSWDASIYPEGFAAGRSTVRLTWGEYQSSLKQRCWDKTSSLKPDSGCSSIHHYEWSKLALFDFLLQIHNRLDQSCCGFKPRHQDVCLRLGSHAECGNPNHIQLKDIHRGNNPRHLLFTNNKGFFDRNEDNLDFRLLEGIKELPEQAVSVLRSMKLREKLLQSLFLDQTYWESQGGRQGIDKLIDVIERRAKVLLTYINAHGIKVIKMNV